MKIKDLDFKISVNKEDNTYLARAKVPGVMFYFIDITGVLEPLEIPSNWGSIQYPLHGKYEKIGSNDLTQSIDEEFKSEISKLL